MIRVELDARRLLCPLPVIRLQDRVAQLQTGDEVVITATDPGVKLDIPAWCRVHGHEARQIEAEESPGEVRFQVTVGPAEE